MARGDVLRVRLPDQGGHEQLGERPAVAVPTDQHGAALSTIMIVPFTSRPAAGRLPFTLRVQPSAQNGLKTASVLLISQLRAIDRSRIIETIGRLEASYLADLDRLLKELLDLA